MGVLTHVVLFTWKAGTSEQDVAALRQALSTLPGLIPQIRAYRFGPDAGLETGNAEFGVVADLDDVEAYRVYAAHPAHRDVIDHLAAPNADRRTAVQLETPTGL